MWILFLVTIFLRDLSVNEESKIREDGVRFFAEQLFETGYFENREQALLQALAAAELDRGRDRHYRWIVSQEAVCGYLMYTYEEQEAYLDALYIEEEYRGQGIGGEALQWLESELREQGIQKIRLYVFAQNKPAFSLYSKLGYAVEESYTEEGKLLGHHMIKVL